MNIVSLSTYTATPHFETELEIIKNHLDRGDDVTIVQCREQFPTCLINPEHKKSICLLCQSKFSEGIRRLHNRRLHVVPTTSAALPSHFREQFSSVSELKKYMYQGVPLGLFAASTLISRYQDHEFDTVKYKSQILNEFCTGWNAYKTMLAILDKTKPARVYIFNGRFSAQGAAMEACKQRHITFYSHEQSMVLDKYVVLKNEMPQTFTALKKQIISLWRRHSKMSKQKILAEHFETKRLAGNRLNGNIPDDFVKTKHNIVIYNSSRNEYEALAESEENLYSKENDALDTLLSHFQHKKSFHFYLRVHPNLTGLQNTQMQEIRHLQSQYQDILTVISPESPVNSYTLLDACEKVITFGSTMGVESTYWRKPSILFGRCAYENLNCCFIASTGKDLIRLVEKPLKPKPVIGALKYAYWELMYGIPFRWYTPMGTNNGKFLGSPIMPSYRARMLYYPVMLADRIKSVFASYL